MPTYTCALCTGPAAAGPPVVTDNCNTNFFATTDANQVGTCAAGVCSYTSACSSNTDCALSNLCQTTTTNGVSAGVC